MHTTHWPGRPLIFTLIGAISAGVIYFLIDGLTPTTHNFDIRSSAATVIFVFSVSFAIIAQRERWLSGLLYALTLGAIAGGIVYWRLFIEWLSPFSFFALAIALFIITPFYQTSLHSKFSDYKSLHHHAWSNVVIVPLGTLFVGLSFAMAHLLAELFSTIGVDILKDALKHDLTTWLVGGVALGASLGVLREYDNIIASTQRLVQSVFSLLTCPMALGLAVFLLILPFTGLDALWDSTTVTSALLFSCASVALVFINSVVRDDAENQSNNRFMQWAARILALCLAPLAIIAALGIKLRVDQYGWTPGRMWITVICVLLAAYGVFYLLATLRRRHFNETVRHANLVLAIVTSALALLLATPLLDFGAYSTKDQLARLTDGRNSEDTFDPVAFAFDFGPAGKQALKDLKPNASAQLSKKIDKALNAKSRWQATRNGVDLRSEVKALVTVLNGPDDLPEELITTLNSNRACRNSYCYIYWGNTPNEAYIIDEQCTNGTNCEPSVKLLNKINNQWRQSFNRSYSNQILDALHASDAIISTQEFKRQLNSAAKNGKIELLPVQRMQIHLDGHAIGPVVK